MLCVSCPMVQLYQLLLSKVLDYLKVKCKWPSFFSSFFLGRFKALKGRHVRGFTENYQELQKVKRLRAFEIVLATMVLKSWKV